MSTPQKVTATTQAPQLQAVTTAPVAATVSIPQPTSTRGGVQVQVLSSQSQTQGSSNGTSSTLSTNPATTLLTGIGAQEIQAQLAQFRALQLPEQQKQLLIAAQLQAQHLKSSTLSATLPASASIVLQPGATLQGLTVVTTAPSTTTTKSSGQFVSQYPDTATFVSQSVTQPTMLSLQQSHVVQSTGYYDASAPLQQQGLGGHIGIHHSGQDHLPITHTTRAHPQTIQWLFENYETAEGVSLPRSTLYNHYLRHCAANKIDAVNAASFGKLIRSVFIGLKTRRLGTRGNSKYHYYGIRIKPDSPLNTFPQDDSPVVAMRQPSQSSQRDYPGEVVSEGGEGSSQPELTPQQQHQQYLGEARPELPSFPEIEWTDINVPDTITADDIGDFTALYREHCEAILDVVVNLQFQMVENLWHHFWNDKPSSISDEGTDDDGDQTLPREKLLLLTTCLPVVEYLNTCDHILYQCIVDFLVPNVLRPIPGTLTQAIRNFAKSLESWLAGSLEGYSSTLTKSKVCAVVAFSQTLRRYTSLNHLAQAARAVLQNTSQISQMLSDLNRVDFGNVQEQASWVCECDEGLVSKLEQDFKTTLEQQNTLEQWATWLESVCNTVLKQYEGGPQFSKAARQFLLKWSFYSSMVIRDLTLRSAASFGSFHLIRLLYDEYMFFLIEHKVARAAGKTPIAVMTEFAGNYRGAFPEGGDFGKQSLPLEAQDIDEEPQAKRLKL